MQELSWRAHFNDGRTLTRKDVPYYQLNRDGLTKFELVDSQGNTVIALDVADGKIPFYRWYRTIPHQWSFYMVGWRSKTAQQIFIIDDSGTWELTHFHDKWYEPEWQQTETPDGLSSQP